MGEFSAEFSDLFSAIQASWVKENGYNCGAIMSPYTVVSQTLEDLTTVGKVLKTVDGLKFWSIA